eukprot:1336594-Rhodomonas_salina.2
MKLRKRAASNAVDSVSGGATKRAKEGSVKSSLPPSVDDITAIRRYNPDLDDVQGSIPAVVLRVLYAMSFSDLAYCALGWRAFLHPLEGDDEELLSVLDDMADRLRFASPDMAGGECRHLSSTPSLSLSPDFSLYLTRSLFLSFSSLSLPLSAQAHRTATAMNDAPRQRSPRSSCSSTPLR